MDDKAIPVDSAEISVIVQGPLYRRPKHPRGTGIFEALESIKRFFPRAEIIISTWEHEDVSGLEEFKVIRQPDPGGYKDSNATVRNFNRQLISTRSGVRCASRSYVLKTRADVIFTSAKIAFISKRPSKIFDSPISTTNFFIRDISRVPFLFHLSDVVHFGRKSDLLDLWESSLETESLITRNSQIFEPFRYSSSKFDFCPEQALCIYWLRRHGYDVQIPFPGYISQELSVLWISILLSEFNIIDYKSAGIGFPPHFYNSAFPLKSVYSSRSLSNYRNINSAVICGNREFVKAILFTRVLAPFNKIFWMSNISNALMKFPKVHSYLFSFYRARRNR